MHRIIPSLFALLICLALPARLFAAEVQPATLPERPLRLPHVQEAAPSPTLSELLQRLLGPLQALQQTIHLQSVSSIATTAARQTPEERILSHILPSAANETATTTTLRDTLARFLKLRQSSETPTLCLMEPFQRVLTPGMRDPEVQKLQRFLNHNRRTRVAKFGPGAPGKETTYYGPATTDAVKRFQALFAKDILAPSGLQAPTGIWGPASIKQANTIITRCKALREK